MRPDGLRPRQADAGQTKAGLIEAGQIEEAG
jgi:hypothetical protein